MPKVKSKKQQSSFQIEEFKGIVANRAIYWYAKYPQDRKRFIDLEDFIQDGMAHITARIRKFDPTRGVKVTTFVYYIANEFYKVCVMGCYLQKNHTQELVSYEDELEHVQSQQNGYEGTSVADRLDAFKKVSNLHREASYDLVYFLDQHLYNSSSSEENTRVSIRGKKFAQRKQEFLRLCQLTGTTIEDYRLALHMHHLQAEAQENAKDSRPKRHK